jgi:hypothetical protein
MTELERLTRVLFHARHGEGKDGDFVSGHEVVEILEAMRDIDPYIIDVGSTYVEGCDLAAAKGCWQAMINAILDGK